MLRAWIAVPKDEVLDETILFTSCTTNVVCNICEAHVRKDCTPLTLGQRCADWFVLRQFRVTGTNVGVIMMYNSAYSEKVGAVERSGPSLTTGKWLKKFQCSWFSTKVLKEERVQGSMYEALVSTAVRGMPFISDIYSVGMVGSTDHPYLACSPDGIALINADGVVFPLLERTGDIVLQSERM